MATAQFEIKDASGKVVLDLSRKITRTTMILNRSAPTGSLVSPELIRLGTAAERPQFWCATRFAKTVKKDGTEYAPIPIFSVFVCTKAELSSGAAPQGVKNYYLPLMDDNSTYLCIVDARSATDFGSNNAVINVGMF